MCGITGLLDLNSHHPPDRATLERMAACLTHRGPDDDGFYLAPPLGLAARRLSIVDVAGGHMPLSNEDQSVWIVHNGEVYNAPELRGELRAHGHAFRTHGDTEVIVHAYDQWGVDCIARLRGMFALALWDLKRQRLLLARDRFGVKPLYYAQADGKFSFGSEIMPTLLGAGLARVADLASLQHLFMMGYLPSARTMFVGVQSLPPAHLMTIENGRCEMRPYWSLQFPRAGEHARLSQDEAIDKFFALLRESVRMRLMSDVPIGALLSGGLDSSSLVALLQALSGGHTTTFSIGFEADTHDEAKYARCAADELHTDHHTLEFSLRDFELWPQVIQHMESPQCSATSIPLYRLYHACHAAGYKVILTGEGADELLGGYHWFAGDARIRPLLRIPQPIRARLAPWTPIGSLAGRRVLAHGTLDPVERFALWSQATSEIERNALQIPTSNIQLPTQRGERHGYNAVEPSNLQPPISHLQPLDQFLYLEAHTRLPNFINDEVDRTSMAHSVEARVPFLDHKLWEFTATLPPHFKLNGGIEKRLLRAAMKGKLPDAIRLRRKQGLAAPHALFWRQSRLPAFVADAIGEASLHETGYFNASAVMQMHRAHAERRADHSRLLTGVLTTQLWHDICLRE